MSIGHSFRSGFQSIFRMSKQTLIIYNNWNTPEESFFEVEGMKNSKGKSSKQVLFQFLDPIEEIATGSVIQIKGARDLWRVTETEDHLEAGVYLNFDVLVVKIDKEGKSIGISSSTHNIINARDIYGFQQGGANNNQSVSVTKNSGIDDNILKMIEIINKSSMSQYDKDEATHNLKQIQALSKEEKSPDVIKKAKEKLELVQATIKTATDLAPILMPYLPAIAQQFGS